MKENWLMSLHNLDVISLHLSGFPPEKEKQLTGIYDLVAVLTHKGRSADSGHYVAWVKQENGLSSETIS